MGQQPNIELAVTDAPRRKPSPGVARSWRPNRPGELLTPGDVPRSGAFGVVGPDAGYALKLVEERRLRLLPGEHHHDAATAVAAIATARAARSGRGPIGADIDVGMLILGLDKDNPPSDRMKVHRPGWIANVGHRTAKLRGIVSDVPAEILSLDPDSLRAKLASGWEFRGVVE